MDVSCSTVQYLFKEVLRTLDGLPDCDSHFLLFLLHRVDVAMNGART